MRHSVLLLSTLMSLTVVCRVCANAAEAEQPQVTNTVCDGTSPQPPTDAMPAAFTTYVQPRPDFLTDQSDYYKDIWAVLSTNPPGLHNCSMTRTNDCFFRDDHWTIPQPGNYIRFNFTLDCAPEEATLYLYHLTSADSSCPNGGYSPVDIDINGINLRDNFDVAANHGGTHGWVQDEWTVQWYGLHRGDNEVRITAQNGMCTHYWLQVFRLIADGCLGCNDDADCGYCEYCWNHECYEHDCCDNGDCSGSTPYCENHNCVECTRDSHCACGYCSGNTCHGYQCCDNADCSGSEPYCLNHECVECTADSHCDCGYCSGHICHAYECCDDGDCPGSRPYCEAHDCVECTQNRHCLDGQVCVDGACQLTNQCHNAPYLIGGAVYNDCGDPIAGGVEGVAVRVECDGGFNATTMSAAGQGLWSISGVPCDFCTVTAENACRVQTTCPPDPCDDAAVVQINDDNVADNQSLGFYYPCMLYDMNGDGFRSIIGDVPCFVECLYLGACSCAESRHPCACDGNGDGFCSIIGDVPYFVDCVYLGNCSKDGCQNAIATVAGGGSSGSVIGGAVYEDAANPLTTGVEGMAVDLISPEGSVVSSTVSGPLGIWRITDVSDGIYQVQFRTTRRECSPNEGAMTVVVSKKNVVANQSIQYVKPEDSTAASLTRKRRSNTERP